jgi:DnaJ domain
MRELTEIASYCKILDILPAKDLNLTTIKAAYHKKALECHPDKHPGKQEEATENFKEILNAWTYLREMLENESVLVEPSTKSSTPDSDNLNSGNSNSSDGSAMVPEGEEVTVCIPFYINEGLYEYGDIRCPVAEFDASEDVYSLVAEKITIAMRSRETFCQVGLNFGEAVEIIDQIGSHAKKQTVVYIVAAKVKLTDLELKKKSRQETLDHYHKNQKFASLREKTGITRKNIIKIERYSYDPLFPELIEGNRPDKGLPTPTITGSAPALSNPGNGAATITTLAAPSSNAALPGNNAVEDISSVRELTQEPSVLLDQSLKELNNEIEKLRQSTYSNNNKDDIIQNLGNLFRCLKREGAIDISTRVTVADHFAKVVNDLAQGKLTTKHDLAMSNKLLQRKLYGKPPLGATLTTIISAVLGAIVGGIVGFVIGNVLGATIGAVAGSIMGGNIGGFFARHLEEKHKENRKKFLGSSVIQNVNNVNKGIYTGIETETKGKGPAK